MQPIKTWRPADWPACEAPLPEWPPFCAALAPHFAALAALQRTQLTVLLGMMEVRAQASHSAVSLSAILHGVLDTIATRWTFWQCYPLLSPLAQFRASMVRQTETYQACRRTDAIKAIE